MFTQQSANNIIKAIRHEWETSELSFPPELIAKYRSVLYSCCGNENIPLNGYENVFYFANESFTLYWDIPTILDVSSSFPIEPGIVSDCFERVSVENLNRNKVKAFISDFPENPILIAEIPFSDKGYCVIDGNHRVAAAKALAVNTINSICLSYKYHPNFMPEKSKLLFCACCDLHTLTNYFKGNLSAGECYEQCIIR